MVEQFNCSLLLQLLCTYVDKEEDWEKYQLLVLLAYHSAPHSYTGCSLFLLIFGCQSSTSTLLLENSFDATSYHGRLRAKLADLRDLVEINIVSASAHQKSTYDVNSEYHTFTQVEPVWLSVQTRGKLNPKWERWLVSW